MDSISGVTTQNSATTTAGTTATKDLGQDQFLKLLTYQLKSQDPLNPVDNQAFAAQLAQFSQLQELTDIKTLLQNQANTNTSLAQQITNSTLPGMIGKTATISTDTIAFAGESSTSLGYTLPGNAAGATLSITDSSGKVIRTCDISGTNLNQGDHKYTWDGKDGSGNALGSGNYTFSVSYNTGSGSASSADTFINGKISGVKFKTDGTAIVINNYDYSLQNIVGISDN